MREVIPPFRDPIEGDEPRSVRVGGDDGFHEEDVAGGHPRDEEDPEGDVACHLEGEVSEHFGQLIKQISHVVRQC